MKIVCKHAENSTTDGHRHFENKPVKTAQKQLLSCLPKITYRYFIEVQLILAQVERHEMEKIGWRLLRLR